MTVKKRTIEAATIITSIMLYLVLMLAGAFLPLEGSQGPEASTTPAAAALSEIRISFKLDSRLTKGLYMGDRWVSPPTFTGTSGQDTIEARAQGLDVSGKRTSISPEWIPSDPEMITVSPSQGGQVTITVKRGGESRLRVTAGGVSKELAVKAAYHNDVIQVEIAPRETEAHSEMGDATSQFKSEKDKLSYALGASLGDSLRKQSIEVDLDLYVQGLKDAVSGGKTLLTEQEVRAAMVALQNELQKGSETDQVAAQREKLRELAGKNKRDGDAFLAENKAKEGVVTLESGLQYKILTAGDGEKPSASDTVVCHYRGTLIDGTEFHSSYDRNQPGTFPLKKVIKGWREALQLMPVGSKWQLFVPSHLAYGPRGAGAKIGPYSTLIFEVELISIKEQVQVKTSAAVARPRRGSRRNASAAPVNPAQTGIGFVEDEEPAWREKETMPRQN